MPEVSRTYEKVTCPTCQNSSFHLDYIDAVSESRFLGMRLRQAAPARLEAVCLRCGRRIVAPEGAEGRNGLELWRPVEGLRVIA